jgi:thymidylate synthase (FAD)
MDLHNLLHFLGLRLDSHAQKEIRVYGEVIKDMTKAVAPFTWEAYEDNILNSVKFTKKQIVILKGLFEDLNEESIAGLLEDSGVGKNEAAEIKGKLNKIVDYII